MKWSKTAAVVFGIVVSEAIWQLYNAYCSRWRAVSSDKQSRKRKKPILEVMFFSKESALCRPHIEQNAPCGKEDCAVVHLRKLICYLNSATETLDVCMYIFTCPALTKAIVNARKRGVVVRMVMDKDMASNQKTIMCFYDNGIKPRMKQLDTLMHHKFVIIDKIILITGSINWTMSAFFGNYESLLVTNEHVAVMPFVNEFEKIWTMLE